MKIAHLCLSCFYIDNFSYQENLLVQQNIKDGHNVIVIASQESMDSSGNVKYVEHNKYYGSDGAMVYRVPYSRIIPKPIEHKFKSYSGVQDLLELFQPDIIFFHGISSYELLTVREYKKKHPHVKFIVDVHSDYNNSAKTWISRNILHRAFYKTVFKLALPYIDKVFCCSLECMDFAIELYNTPKYKCQFYPLGGICLDDEEYINRRTNKREEIGVLDNQILILQTGKFNSKKKLLESLTAFNELKSSRFTYLVVGQLNDEIKDPVMEIINNDKRIKYMGWATPEEIKDYLCASDLYMQPGSQSATMQQSLCLRNPVILDNVKSHRVFIRDNGWLIDNHEQIKEILNDIDRNPHILKKMSENSFDIAKKTLDYRLLSKMILDV